MNPIRIFFLGMLITYAYADAYAQRLKPKFQKLTYVTYEITGHKTVIKDIIEIDRNGAARFRSVYYNGIADTSYQLSNDKIAQLNAIFGGNKPLKGFIQKTHLEPNMHFAGPYDYVTYTDLNGKVDELTIATPLMSSDFNEALDRLAVLPSKIKFKGKVINHPVLEKQIMLSQKKATYLPKIEEPPPMM